MGMKTSESTANENWGVLVEAYNLRLQNEAEMETVKTDASKATGPAFASYVAHKGRFQNRLRITSIAE